MKQVILDHSDEREDSLGEVTFYGCVEFFNPLSANPTKWSNTLKGYV